MALDASAKKDGRFDMGDELPGGWSFVCLIESFDSSAAVLGASAAAAANRVSR
jgi:hypothetical protein